MTLEVKCCMLVVLTILSYMEQLHSMNESITAWTVMQPLNIIEADKVLKMEGINTMLESEQHIMWIYYQRHPLGESQSVHQVVRYG
jgi:hypothetical protein